MNRRVALLLLLVGCITPPAVNSAGSSEIWLRTYPPGTEKVEIPVKGGGPLRGVFVPAEPGAPVVLHLLGSGGSVTMDYSAALFWDLRDRGFASLAVDYEGVGASGGSRSPNHLRRDARAAYAEALRRAGKPGRIVVRGTSIGSLATGSLLEDGADMAAVVLFSPVRGETVAINWMYSKWWDVFAFCVAPFVLPTTKVDLVGALRETEAPLLVVVPESDELLPAKETKLVEDAVRVAGGTLSRRAKTGHLGVAILAFEVTDEEEVLYARLFPKTPPVEQRVAAAIPDGVEVDRAKLAALVKRERYDPPSLAAALVLAGRAEPNRYVRRWLRGLPNLEALPFEALRALVDLRDPAGDLDPRELYASRGAKDPEAAVKRVRDGRWDRRAQWEIPSWFGPVGVSTQTVDLGEGGEIPDGAPARLKLPREESFRQAVRLTLKAAGIPDRMAGGGLEVWVDGTWKPLALAPE